jgi:parvulin-like peptidyl-prolyl isomerase
MTLQAVAVLLLAAAPAPPAVVNGRIITEAEVSRATSERIRATRYHRNPEPEQVLELRRLALDQLVVDELRAQEARRRGLTPDPSVGAVAAGEETAAGGALSFDKLLARSGIDRARYLEVIARPSLAAALERIELEAQPAEPSPAEVQTAYDQGRARYVVPEALRLLELCVGVEPGGDDAAWAQARTRVDALRVRLLAGADFAAEARAAAGDPFAKQGGDLGMVHRGSLEAGMEAAAWALTDGGTSEPIRSFRGWHLVRREATQPARPAAFDEVQASIRAELKAARRKQVLERLDARLRAAATIVLRDGG